MNLKYSLVATAIAIALASPVMPAHAQSAPIITQASSAGTVIGQVKEAASGVYLQGARVSVDGKQVVTERDGSFRLSGLAPGRYSVTQVLAMFAQVLAALAPQLPDGPRAQAVEKLTTLLIEGEEGS